MSFNSCDTETERYLYNKYDPEYDQALALKATECIEDSTFFSVMSTANDFTTRGYALNDIYKITQSNGSKAQTTYIKITALSAASMTVQMNSDEDVYDKVITFTTAEHDKLQTELEQAACNPAYDDYFFASGLDSNLSMSLKWAKETVYIADSDDDDNDEDEKYKQVTDTLTVNLDLPIFFYFYNGTKKLVSKIDSDTDAVSTTDEFKLEEVDSSALECDPSDSSFDNSCDFSTTVGFDSCTFETIADSYKTSAQDSQFFKYTEADCRALELL